MKVIFFLLVLSLLLKCDGHDDVSGGLSQSEPTIAKHAAAGTAVDGEYIVKLRAGVGKGALYDCFGSIEPVIIKKSITENMHLITFMKDPGLEELKKRAATCPDVSFIQPNYRYHAQGRHQDK